MTGLAIDATGALGGRRRAWSRATQATWLGHRAAVLGIGLVFCAFAVVIIVPAVKVNTAYTWYLAHGCTANMAGACQRHLTTVLSEHTWANTVGFLLLLFPLVVGVFVGAPIIAKEIESGTFRFTWTQAAGRTRYELQRLVVLAVVVVACACALGLLMGWFVHPLEALRRNSYWDARLFNSTLLTLPGWSVFSFSLGALSSVAIRRTVPAMAATTMIAGALLFFAGEPAEGRRGSLTTRLLGVLPLTARSRSWLPTTWAGPATGSGFRPRGSWIVRTFTETPMGRRLPDLFGTARPWTTIVHGPQGNVTPGRWLTRHHYTFWYSFQPADRYWTIEIVLAAIAVLVGALLMFVAMRLVHRME